MVMYDVEAYSDSCFPYNTALALGTYIQRSPQKMNFAYRHRDQTL